MPAIDPSRPMSEEEQRRFLAAAAAFAEHELQQFTQRLAMAEARRRHDRFIRSLFPASWLIEFKYDMRQRRAVTVILPR